MLTLTSGFAARSKIYCHKPILKVGDKTFDLSTNWSKLDLKPLQISISEEYRHKISLHPTSLFNLSSYLSLSSKEQGKCLSFAKYLVNAKEYLPISPNRTSKSFLGKAKGSLMLFRNHELEAEHAGIYLGADLCLSKIGKDGLHVTTISQLEEMYDCIPDFTQYLYPKQGYFYSCLDSGFKENSSVYNVNNLD